MDYAKGLVAQADEHGRARRYEQEFALLNQVLAMPVSLGCDENVRRVKARLAQCHFHMGEHDVAHALYTEMCEALDPTSLEYHEVFVRLALVHSTLGDYAMAIGIYRRALDWYAQHAPENGEKICTLRHTLVQTQLASLRIKYHPASAQRICHNCQHIDMFHLMTPCQCQRVWYCNRHCADESPHEHPQIELTQIPADVMRNIIIPMCILPHSSPISWQRLQNEKEARQCGLRLRNMGNRTLRGYVDGCSAFWLQCIPRDWNNKYQPDLSLWPRGECVAQFVIQRYAQAHYRYALKKHVKKAKAAIKSNMKMIATRNAYIEGYKREIESIESESRLNAELIEGLESKLKKMKN